MHAEYEEIEYIDVQFIGVGEYDAGCYLGVF